MLAAALFHSDALIKSISRRNMTQEKRAAEMTVRKPGYPVLDVLQEVGQCDNSQLAAILIYLEPQRHSGDTIRLLQSEPTLCSARQAQK